MTEATERDPHDWMRGTEWTPEEIEQIRALGPARLWPMVELPKIRPAAKVGVPIEATVTMDVDQIERARKRAIEEAEKLGLLVNATRPRARASRWACPECDSTHVRIRVEVWAREDTSFDLTDVEIGEAPIAGWHCRCCKASGDGEPVEFTGRVSGEELGEADRQRRIEEELYREGIV